MKIIISAVIVSMLLPFVGTAQNEEFVLQGTSQTYVNGTPGSDQDILLYRIDGSGSKLWRKNYGGSYFEYSNRGIQTAGGAFLILGWTESFVHGTPGIDRDGLVYKLDADGQKVWRRNLGGVWSDELYRGFETADGNYLVVGSTDSFVHGFIGADTDMFVCKLNSSGVTLWQKNFGGMFDDGAFIGVQCSDGNYLIMGKTYSYVNGAPGTDSDFLLYKLTPAGGKLWRKNYGGAYAEMPVHLFEDAAGDFIISGYTQSFVHGVSGTDWDTLVYKIDAAGKKLWRKNYGGTEMELGLVASGSGSGHHIMAQTKSYVHGTQGLDGDFLNYKIDTHGAKVWRKNLGGIHTEGLGYLEEAPGGGYLISGQTQSFVTGTPGSDYDLVIYHLDAGLSKQWRRNYGGIYGEFGGRLLLLDNGDILMRGKTGSFVNGTPGADMDMLIYRLNAQGQKLWRKNFGGSFFDDLFWVYIVQ